MGTLREPLPVKLFVGMLSADAGLFETCIRALSLIYGPPDRASVILPWDHTDYYGTEMGPGLQRKFVFFRRPVPPDVLSWCKTYTDLLERTWSGRGGASPRRTINIDPGYVTEAKVVLASSKDFAHRVSIGNRVYAEVTLQYDRELRAFVPGGHTYPDFRSPDVLRLFDEARQDLRDALGRNRRT